MSPHRPALHALFACTLSVATGNVLAMEGSAGTFRPAARSAAVFSLRVAAEHQQVEEFLPSGRRLLVERGTVPLVGAGLGVPFGPGGMRISAELSDGTIDYRGSTQGGTAIATDTAYRTWRLAAGYELPLGQSLSGIAGLAHEERQRAIAGVGRVAGLDERYRNTFATLGVRLQMPWRHASLSVEGIIGLSASERIRFQTGLDEATLTPGRLHGWRLGVNVPLDGGDPGQGWSVQAGVELLRSAASGSQPLRHDGVAVGSVRQPEMHRISARLALVRAWGR